MATCNRTCNDILPRRCKLFVTVDDLIDWIMRACLHPWPYYPLRVIDHDSIGLHLVQGLVFLPGQMADHGVEDLPLEVHRGHRLAWQNTGHLGKYNSSIPVSHAQIHIHTIAYTHIDRNRSLQGGRIHGSDAGCSGWRCRPQVEEHQHPAVHQRASPAGGTSGRLNSCYGNQGVRFTRVQIALHVGVGGMCISIYIYIYI